MSVYLKVWIFFSFIILDLFSLVYDMRNGFRPSLCFFLHNKKILEFVILLYDGCVHDEVLEYLNRNHCFAIELSFASNNSWIWLSD